jgi:hypothetical protein
VQGAFACEPYRTGGREDAKKRGGGMGEHLQSTSMARTARNSLSYSVEVGLSPHCEFRVHDRRCSMPASRSAFRSAPMRHDLKS